MQDKNVHNIIFTHVYTVQTSLHLTHSLNRSFGGTPLHQRNGVVLLILAAYAGIHTNILL